MTNVHKQKGSSLLEALIAFVVLSFGVLGLVGTQASAIAASTQAETRLRASLLATEMLSTLIADANNAECYTGAPGKDCSAASAEFSERWHAEVGKYLPNSSSYPPTLEVIGGRATLTLSWKRTTETVVHNYVVQTHIRPGVTP